MFLVKFELNYLEDSSTVTATATVAPTMGLLPIPIRPIISTQGRSGGYFCIFFAVKIADKIRLFKRKIVKSYCLEHIVFLNC